MSSQPRLSADGLFYWDGKQWVSALSPDGRQRWDGSAWVPIPVAPAYAPAPGFMPMPAAQPAPKPPRMATSWTRPMQYAASALFAILAVWSAAVPFWLSGPATDYARRNALSLAQANPDLYPDPSQYAATVANAVTIALAVTSIAFFATAGVVVVGSLRRWTWIHYAVMVLLALAILGTPVSIANLLMPPGPEGLTPGLAVNQWFGIAFGIVSVPLFAWMLVAVLRRGPWAMSRALPAQ